MVLQGRLETENQIEDGVLKKLSEMPIYVQSWYYSLRAQDVSIKSCRDYLNKINHFLLYLNEDISKVELKEMTDFELSRYFISIQTKKDKNDKLIKTSDSYRNTVWFALNNFFEYQLKVGNIKKNYMPLVKPKKNKSKSKSKSNKAYLSSNDFKKMLCFIPGESEIIKKRNKAILLLYMTTGMRRDALRQINISDIESGNHLVVIDKGEKTQIYDLNKETINAINDWLVVRSELLHNNINDALFLTYQGKRISGNAIYNMVTETTETALGKKLSPHKLRGGLCSILYEQTHDLEFVRKAIGHENISTTEIYIKTKDDERHIASQIMENLLK